MGTISTKPYLLRAIYEWCNDCGFTPYLSVIVDEHTVVPLEHVVNGEIVLNISPSATHSLELGNELISFQARFGGVARQLSIPIANVAAIYARENGHGMAFDVTTRNCAADPETGAGRLRVDAESGPRPQLSAVPDADTPESASDRGSVHPISGSGPDPDDPPPARRKPRLTRIK